MRNQLRKWMMLTGMVCVMGLGTCGCGGTEEPEKPVVDEPEALPDDAQEEDLGEQVPEEDSEEEMADSGGQKGRRTDKEDLIGTVQEIGDMQFTVAEVISEDMEDGSMLMVGLGEGEDDSDFARITITYDEDTLFYMRTIYDNGARYEDSDASADDLAENQTTMVWGTYEGNGEKLHAEQVQMEQFVN